MNYLDSFLRGLTNAYSWRSGQDNALIGGEPSWTYLIGLGLNFLVIYGLTWLVLFAIYTEKKGYPSWKFYFNEKIKNMIQKRERSRTSLTALIGFSIMLIGFPCYGAIRLANGIWRYHYFTEQKTTEKVVVVTNVDSVVGNYRGNFSRITLTVSIENSEHIINISNSTRKGARLMKRNFQPPQLIKVRVNEAGKIVFVD